MRRGQATKDSSISSRESDGYPIPRRALAFPSEGFRDATLFPMTSAVNSE